MPSPWVRRALNNDLPAQAYAGTAAAERAADQLIPTVVDGPILPEDMCLGSESRQVMSCGDTVQCSTCQRWLPAYPGSFMAPVHATEEVTK